MPDIAEKITNSLADPKVLLAAAKHSEVSSQQGGGTDVSSMSTALVFGVALLAFGGYTMYTLRSMTTSTVDSNDDSPPDPNAVRRVSS